MPQGEENQSTPEIGEEMTPGFVSPEVESKRTSKVYLNSQHCGHFLKYTASTLEKYIDFKKEGRENQTVGYSVSSHHRNGKLQPELWLTHGGALCTSTQR